MMKVPRWRVLAGVGLLVLVGIGAYVYRVNREANQVAGVIAQGMLKGYPAKPVDPEGWKRVHVGMTKDEVLGLLGEAPHKGTEPGEDSREYWEYGHVSSVFAPVPDNLGHVVYFDKQGLVSSTREPTRDGS
jgi:hypothetical protein